MIQILTIRDYNNNEYPLLAVKIVNSELNGQEDIELTIHQQKNNDLDLKTVDKLWEIDYQNITYKIVYVKQQTRGSGFYLNVRATPLFYWEFDKSIIHEDNDGSHTANSAFRTVFEGTNYNFVLVDFSPSVEIEGFGKGSTRLELFKRLLDRYNYEFTINGSTVTMRHLVGNDTNFMYKYKLNASNVSRSTDATAMFTHIKGFGNFEEGEEDYFNNAQLKREFTSPLADIVGKWEGPPIVDGRMTQQSTLDNAMQEAVESSLEISVEGTLHDIRKMGYDIAVPIKGDRVWLLDERINLEQEIRVYSVKTTYDEKDNIIDCEVTFGSQSIRERHKANINSLSKNFQDLLTGKLKLPIISLEQIGMDMINAIHAASSEIIFGDFGMQAISKTNPNHVFGLNSEGWYISQDGGRTPRTIATAQGIYADALFAGTLWLTNDLNIEGVDGYLNISSQRFTMRNHNGTSSTVIEPGRLQMNESDIELGGGAKIEFTNASNMVFYSILGPNNYYRTSGMGVGRVLGNDLPFAYLGTTPGGTLDTLDSGFSGLMTHTTYHINNNGAANSISGSKFELRNQANSWDKGVTFDFNGSRPQIDMIGGNSNDYEIGELYAVRGKQAFNIRNYFNDRSGWLIETNYSGGGADIQLRGMHSGEYNYQIGNPIHRIRNIYLTNSPDVSSDERLKENIHDIELGLEFIKDIESKAFRLKPSSADKLRGEYQNDVQYGVIAQQLIIALERHGVDTNDISLVNIDDGSMYSVRYEQLIAPLIKAVQELSKELEALKNAKRADDTE